MARLANDRRKLRDRYGVLVVGSGYGGSIVAARLAEAGHDVCLLERGKEWEVGDFPDEEAAVLDEVRTDHHPMGLFEYVAGEDIDIIVGSGLGGTSLINANVVIAPEASVFELDRWPRGIRQAAKSGELETYCDRVRSELAVTEDAPPGGWPRKVDAMRQSASAVEASFRTLPVAVSYEASKPNALGDIQPACTLCGDCVTGCNIGAKNTLMMNYLPLAKAHGAEIYCGMEAQLLLPAADEGYFVYLRAHEGAGFDEKLLHARIVVLAAGSLGSTAILLRSRERGLALSPKLGCAFSGNADVLGTAYNTDQQTDVLGFGAHGDRDAFPVGPTILSALDYRVGEREGAERFLIEEGAFPRALVDLTRRGGPVLSVLSGQDTDAGFVDKAQEISRSLRDQIGFDPAGAANHTMLYLGMGHDGSDGQIVLDRYGQPRIIWGELSERPVLRRLNDEMYKLTAALGGTYIPHPRASKTLGENTVTVHPLGGCPMADDASEGVVDEFGEVFNGSKEGRHRGLYVADGSILPVAVGVNPLLTISALAERIAEKLLAAYPERIEAVPKSPTPPEPAPLPIGIEMSEELRGHCTASIVDATTPEELKSAEGQGKEEGIELNFRVTILIDDLDRFIETAEHEAPCFGYVESQLYGGRRRIEEGRFNLFVADPESNTKRLSYRLKFLGADGERYLLDGVKEVRDDPGFDSIADMTTLFTTIRKGWSIEGSAVAQGIVRVTLKGFLHQLTTIHARNSPGFAAGVGALMKFGRFFFGELWDSYVSRQVAGGEESGR